MGKSTKYEAKVPDNNGIIPYSEEEHSVWHDLHTRQLKIIEGRVCQEFLDGLDILKLPTDRIPQTRDVSKILHERTGWQVEPVPALINFDRFFQAAFRAQVSGRLVHSLSRRNGFICRSPISSTRSSGIPPC